MDKKSRIKCHDFDISILNRIQHKISKTFYDPLEGYSVSLTQFLYFSLPEKNVKAKSHIG